MKRATGQAKTPVPEAAAAVKPAAAQPNGAQPNALNYRLRLFVTGTTPKSARAIQNIRTICEEHLQGRYDLEVVDIYQHPERVKADQIVVTPTLVKQFPFPLRKLIGDLSDTARVLAALDIMPLQISPTLSTKNAA